MKRCAGMTVVLVGLLSGVMRAAGDPLPTSEEIKAGFDAGKYQETLQKLRRVVDLQGKAAAGYNRYELLMLRGESLLQLKQGLAASEAFIGAKKEAKTAEDAAVAEATGMLIKKSSAYVYTIKPKDKNGEARKIDILDQKVRKEAFRAMYEEELAAWGPRIKAAKETTSLVTLLKFGESVGPLRGLELAATGSNEETKGLLKDLGEHAKELMVKAVATLEQNVAGVDRAANEVLERTVNVPDPNNPKKTIPKKDYRKRGLDNTAVLVLDDAIGTCDRLPGAVKELVNSLSVDAAGYVAVLTDAKRVRDRAATVRSADYSQVGTTPLGL